MEHLADARQLFVFLVAAGIVVPLFQHLKLGIVLGFLIAGLIVGPGGLGHFADVHPVFALVTMSIGPALGLGSALLLNRPLRGRALFRGAYFVPVTTSLIVVATIWKMLLNDQGLVNQILSVFSIPGHDWLTDPSTALFAVCAASIWQGFGFETVIFLAALQTVPRDLLEAAEVDGAGVLRRFWHISLPALRPTILFVSVVGVIGAFQVFDQVFVMTQGGPLESTTTVVYYLVNRFRALDLGHASATAYLLVVVLAIASAAQMRLGRSKP